MGKPAARLGDMHICPMSDGPKPHVGGPIVGPGVPNVMIGGKPAAVVGDMCTCVGPPDSILFGSMGVFIGGRPAARMGDPCLHGGRITFGHPTVLIGDMGSGSVEMVEANVMTPGVMTPKMPEEKKPVDKKKEEPEQAKAAGGGGGGGGSVAGAQSQTAKKAANEGALGMDKC